MKRSFEVIAETLGWDINDVKDCRYQGYSNPIVYSIGDKYFAVHKTKPKHNDVGDEWVINKDQFGASMTSTAIWVCNAEIEGN